MARELNVKRGDETKLIVSTTQLANHLGLSRWTVSRVLNGHADDAKGETRQRILDTAKEMNFVPSPLCGALLGKKSGLIGICFHSIDAVLLARKIQALNRNLREHGYRGIIEISNQTENIEREVISHLISIRVDAIIMTAPLRPPDERITEMLKAYGRPVILLDCPTSSPFTNVTADRSLAYSSLVKELFTLGHRNFGWLGPEKISLHNPRLAGIQKGLKECGLSYERDVVTIAANSDEVVGALLIDSELEYQCGCKMAREFLDLENRPTALIGCNDYIAAGAIRTLIEAGIKVPEEVSVTGYDNSVDPLFFDPSITTCDQQIEALAARAVELLNESFKRGRKKPPATHYIAPKLLFRGSTGPVRPTLPQVKKESHL